MAETTDQTRENKSKTSITDFYRANKDILPSSDKPATIFYLAVVLAACALAIYLCLSAPTSTSSPWALLLLATGLAGAGATIGFLYSTFGDENSQFSQIKIAFNGAVGGATLTDLARDDSLLVRCYHSLARSIGAPDGSHGSVLALAATFLPLGFFLLYFGRKFFLNPFQSEQQERIRNEQGRATLAAAVTVTADTDNPFTASALPRGLAEAQVNRVRSDADTFDDHLADARAYLAIGDLPAAHLSLDAALALRPRHPVATLYYAAVQCAQKSWLEAIATLEQLVLLPQTPIAAFKLLGYAYLYLPADFPDRTAKLWRAVAVTGNYLRLNPTDTGARLNLACAYGQLGPKVPQANAKLPETLRLLFKLDPAARERVKHLTTDDGDFAAWTESVEFKALLAPQADEAASESV